MLLPRIYRDKLPQFLAKPTKEKIEKHLAEKQKKLLISTHPENYHPDILQIIANWQKQKKYEQELNDFKNQIINGHL